MGSIASRNPAATVAAVFALLLSWAVAGCNRAEEKGGPPPTTPAASSTGGAPAAAADATNPEAGVMKGTATTVDGKPLKTFGGSIYGYSLKSGQSQTLSIDGADGRYRVNLGPGQFAARAWTDVEYNGHKY